MKYTYETWNPRYTFSGKERDEETGYSYFGARYYNPDLSIWLSVDPMSDKYPSLSPYVYCGDNPVRLVDVDGRETGPIWPKKGVNTYSWKIKGGTGLGFGLAYSLMGGISLDRHGKTHWTAQNYKYLVNQNLQEGSTNPAFEIGVDLGLSLNFDRNCHSESFIESLNSSSISMNIGGIPRLSLKGVIGGSIGGGKDSFSIGGGLGISLGFATDPYFIIESISISKAEDATLGNLYSHWSVVDQKYDQNTNTFQGVLKNGNTKTNIRVFCPAQDDNGVLKPNCIWTSEKYLK